MSWGLHDSVEFEKRSRPAVTVITQAFKTPATIRAKTLGMPEHPVVVVEHPIASRTEAEILEMAERFVDSIVKGLVAK